MKNWYLILRWSWRDLRKYWVKVIAIALVIGIGTGAYAGLTSTANWRRDSNVASMELLNMYDMRFELATDSSVPAGELAAAAASIEHAAWIEGSIERLIRPTQVDASTATDTVLVVLVPESGDNIQTLKAGLMEIGDVFTVNKSDRSGAEDMASSIRTMLDLAPLKMDWHPTVFLTAATLNQGIDDLYEGLWDHYHHLQSQWHHR